jgi:hypothetical protein
MRKKMKNKMVLIKLVHCGEVMAVQPEMVVKVSEEAQW